MLELTTDLFFVWHADKADWYDLIAVPQSLIPIRQVIRGCLLAGVSHPLAIASFRRALFAQWTFC